MHDPLFDTTPDTTSDAGSEATSPATNPAGSPASSPDYNDARSSSLPAMAPPSGRPLTPTPYQWPAPTGGPVGAPVGPPAGAPLALVPPPAVAGQRSDTYKGLAIASFVLSLLAVVGVLLFGLGALDRPASATSSADSSSADPGPDPNGMSSGPLTGNAPVQAGKSLPGADLANAVEHRIHDDGAKDISMDCPDTRKVAQGVVTVCHGQIEGEDWAVVVYFEDDLGRFTLNPL